MEARWQARINAIREAARRLRWGAATAGIFGVLLYSGILVIPRETWSVLPWLVILIAGPVLLPLTLGIPAGWIRSKRTRSAQSWVTFTIFLALCVWSYETIKTLNPRLYGVLLLLFAAPTFFMLWPQWHGIVRWRQREKRLGSVLLDLTPKLPERWFEWSPQRHIEIRQRGILIGHREGARAIEWGDIISYSFRDPYDLRPSPCFPNKPGLPWEKMEEVFAELENNEHAASEDPSQQVVLSLLIRNRGILRFLDRERHVPIRISREHRPALEAILKQQTSEWP